LNTEPFPPSYGFTRVQPNTFLFLYFRENICRNSSTDYAKIIYKNLQIYK
jgi:hypothetical protein